MLSLTRKYAKTAWMEAGGHVNDSLLFLADYGLRFIRVLVLLSLWRILLAGRGPVAGMDLATLLTYTLISEVFAEQFAARTHVEFILWQGALVTRFLRPLGLVGTLTSEAFGRWMVALPLFSLPLLLAAPLLGVNPLPVSLRAAALFAVSVALAIAVGLAVDFIFAALTVVVDTNVWVMDQFRSAVGMLLSGAVLPLALMPWGIGDAFAWLPFASMASAPLRIFIGSGNPIVLLAIQAGWAVVLWPVGGALWQKYREKLASYGG